MKILAIRGKNLASLEHEFDIDFMSEPLRSSGIFAITGQTGAGKSTILDALCLALFDNAPRLYKAEPSIYLSDVEDKSITQKDSRNILRRGATEGYAEVDFVALNGDKYRSKWMVRRARGKQDGALQATTIKLENLTTKVEEGGTKSNLLSRIVELIGLTFDQFTRAVLLAQGEFANFLKAKSKDKAELLEKLTGTEVYSKISTSIYQNTSEAKNELNLILQQIGLIQLLSIEELDTIVKEQIVKKEELNLLKIETDAIDKKLVWIKQYHQSIQAVEDANKNLEIIQTTQRNILPRREYMEVVDQSLEIRDTYLELINTQTEQSKLLPEIEKTEEQLKQIVEQQSGIDAKLTEAKVIYELVMLEYNEQKPNIALAKELDTKIQTVMDEVAEQKKELDTYKKQYSDSELIVTKLKESLVRTKEGKASIEKWFSEKAVYKTIIPKIDLLRNLIDTAYESHKQKLNAADGLKSSKSLLNDLLAQLAQCESEQERLNLLLPTEIIVLRQRLAEGDPCPVCGSIHHPFKDEVIQSQQINEVQLENDKKRIQERIEKIRTQTDQAQKSITQFETYINNFEDQYVRSFSNLGDHLQSLTNWTVLFEEWTLIKELSSMAEQWTEYEKQQQNSLTLLNDLVSKIEAEERGEKQIEENIKNKEKRIESINQVLTDAMQSRKKLLNGKTTESIERYFANKIDSTTKILEELRDLQNKIITQRSALSGKIDQQKDHLEKTKVANVSFDNQVRQWLDRNQHRITIDLLKDVISKSREWIGQEKQYLTEIDNKELAIQTVLQERKDQLQIHLLREDKPKDDETKEYLDGQLNSTSQQIEVVNHRLSEIEILLSNYQKGKEQMKIYEKTLNDRKETYENWSKLNDLLGSQSGDKFKTIAQGYTLDVLLGYANNHLQNLTKRYSLQRVSDTLGLQVVDRDMLDEVRSVHSLSGGESFLISLALALGLSSLSSNKMKIESLFIDEGFGALDIDTLSMAMDALENLQAQGRKIGVISHVEEMKECITTQIRVIKSGNGKSNIQIVG